LLARHDQRAAQTGQRPVQRAQQAVAHAGRIDADASGTTPFIGHVEHDGAGTAEASAHTVDLMAIRITGAFQPSPGRTVAERE
jgi:hypothetical protein